jgi:hypothetical protein
VILLLGEASDHDHARRRLLGMRLLLGGYVGHSVVDHVQLLGASHARAHGDATVVVRDEDDPLRQRRGPPLDPARPEALECRHPLGERPPVRREESRQAQGASRQPREDARLGRVGGHDVGIEGLERGPKLGQRAKIAHPVGIPRECGDLVERHPELRQLIAENASYSGEDAGLVSVRAKARREIADVDLGSAQIVCPRDDVRHLQGLPSIGGASAGSIGHSKSTIGGHVTSIHGSRLGDPE